MIAHLEVMVNNLEFYQTADKNVAPIHPDGDFGHCVSGMEVCRLVQRKNELYPEMIPWVYFRRTGTLEESIL